MTDIIDSEEVDKDTVDPETLEAQFSIKYKLLIENTVSLKKSYVNRLSVTKSLKLAVSLSDNSIEVYELNGAALKQVCRLIGHKKPLTDIVFSPKEDHLLFSCSHDGIIKMWDTRTNGSCAQEYKDEKDEQIKPFDCMDVSCNARVLCAGSQVVQDDAFLVFWDQRQPQPLGGYWNSHTDDISQVRFHPSRPETLATGAGDGLLNIFNILETSEDDALLYSLNVENSVERLSWLNDHELACITQSNDLQIWNDEGDLVKSFSREKIAKGIRRSKEDDCYLVDAFTAGGSPVVLAGSNAGDGCLRTATLDKKAAPRSALAANSQVVRCCHYDERSDLLVTAGEGGVISVWTGDERSDARGVERGGAKLSQRLDKLHVNRHKPY